MERTVSQMEATECGLLIKQISDQTSKAANHVLRAYDLTLSQFRCLEYIRENPAKKVPFKEMEAHFCISQPTLAGIVARLARKGLLATEASEVNPRAKTASLTPQGLELFLQADAHRETVENSLLAPLSPEEKRTFYELLKKVNDGLKNI